MRTRLTFWRPWTAAWVLTVPRRKVPDEPLFNTITRAGGVLGAAAFGTAHLALARDHQPVHSFATISLALAVTAPAAAALAG